MRTTLKGFVNWEKAGMVEWQTPIGIVRLLISFTQYNGDLITQFEINDNMETNVPCKVSGRILNFQECNSFGGTREFLNNSIVYEYLLKPLNIDISKHPRRGKDGWDVTYSDYHSFKQEAKRLGFKQIN